MSLKPCPDCGSGNLMVDRCTSSIRCKRCGAKSPGISKYISAGMEEKEAMEMAWNTRTPGGGCKFCGKDNFLRDLCIECLGRRGRRRG